MQYIVENIHYKLAACLLRYLPLYTIIGPISKLDFAQPAGKVGYKMAKMLHLVEAIHD